MPRRLAAWLLVLIIAVTHARSAETPPPEPKFSRDVAPLLFKQCVACHGAKGPKGEFQLDSYQHLLKSGSSGESSLTPGKPDESELLRRITTPDVDERMPQEGEPLPREQIALIRRWIAAGAKFDGDDPATPLTTLIPPATHPPAPEKYSRPLPITALAFHPSGDELAVCGYHEITIWSAQSGKLLRRIPDIAERTLCLAYSPDGRTLAAASGNPGQLGEVKLLDPATGLTIRTVVRLTDMASCVAFDPSGDRLACGGLDRTVQVYKISDGSRQWLIEEHADAVTSLAWRPDGQQLATASRDKTCKLIDMTTGQVISTFHGHGEPVLTIAYSDDGKRLASAGHDQRVRVWRDKEHQGKEDHELDVHEDLFQLVPGKSAFYGCGSGRAVQLFDLQAAKSIRLWAKQPDELYALALRPDSKRIATGGYDGKVTVWDTETGEQLLQFTAAPGIGKQ